MKLTNKQKRGVKRRVTIDQGISVPNSSAFVNKKKYTRKVKAGVEAGLDYKLNTNTKG